MLMVQNKLTDTAFVDSVEEDLARLHRLGLNMQRMFREWNEIEERTLTGPPGRQHTLLLKALGALTEKLDDDGVREALRWQVSIAEASAVAFFHRAVATLDERPAEDQPINPYAVGVKPERWESEGLFEGPGITGRDALEQIDGLDWLFDTPDVHEVST
jgi:hypothetical protein